MSRHWKYLPVLALAVAACSDSTGPEVRQPAELAKIAGDETAPAGSTIALTVRVTDDAGEPVSDVTVNWAVTSGGGSVSPASSATGANGEATTPWTLGAASGLNRATAMVSGLDHTTFTALGTGDEPFIGLVVFDFAGDQTGTYVVDTGFDIGEDGPTTDTWALAFYDADHDEHVMLALKATTADRGDLAVLVVQGPVTSARDLEWDYEACIGGDTAMCVADGLVAFGQQLDDLGAEPQRGYYMDFGTMSITSVADGRLIGSFEADAFTYDGSDLAILLDTGAFNLPNFADDVVDAGANAQAAVLQHGTADPLLARFGELLEEVRARRRR